MALRGGESVGSAYVRIYATGDGVPDDIRRIMHEAEPSVREGGREHGRTYADEFDEEMRKGFHTHFDEDKTMFRDLNDNLTESLARLNLADDFFGKSLVWKKFKRRLSDEFGEAGRLAGTRLEQEFRDSTDLEKLPDRMRHIGIEIRKAQAEILASEQDVERRTQQSSLREATLFRERMKDIIEQVDRLEKGEPGVRRSRLIEMLADLKRIAPAISKSDSELVRWVHHIDDQNRRLRESVPLLSTWENRWSRVADTMGRIFGRGSRNNFLNFFGSVVRNLLLIGNIVPGTIGFFAKRINDIREAFAAGGGGLQGTMDAFLKGITGVGGALLTATGAGIAFLGFIALLGIALGPVVGLLSTFVGLLLAMASSAVMAVIGALAGFGPLLFAAGGAVAGVLAVVAAIKDVSNAAPQMKAAISGIRDEASRLWDIFKDRALVDLPSVLEQANHAFHGMTDLVVAAGDGFRRFLDEIADSIDSPAMQAFFDRFARFLPHTMDRLGRIIGDVFTGLAGILRASIPSANILSGHIADIADNFSKWANSAKGQQQIKDFLDRAGDSASAVFDFLEGAFHWLVQLIDKSESTGDSLWTRLGGQFQEWAEWIEAHPDEFQQWMEDSEELAGNISTLVDGLIKLIDILDSHENRGFGGDLLSGLGEALGGLAFLIVQVNSGILYTVHALSSDLAKEVVTTIANGFAEIGKGVWYVVAGKWVGDLFDAIETVARSTWDHVAGVFRDLIGSLADLKPHGGGAMLITPHLDTSAIIRGLRSLGGVAQRAAAAVLSPFRGLANRIASAAGNITGRIMGLLSSLPGRVSTVASQVVSRWGSLAERIARAVGDVWRQLSSHFTSIPGQVAGVVDQIVGAFAGLAGRILAQVGHIDLGSLMHGSIDPPGPLGPWSWATGGVATTAVIRRIGEAGPEAVVPLDRPLSMVDPSVRLLSAIAQGKLGDLGGGGGKVVKADNWTIVTPSQDPRIVATEVLNELVARVV